MTVIEGLFDIRYASQISYSILMAYLTVRSCPDSRVRKQCGFSILHGDGDGYFGNGFIGRSGQLMILYKTAQEVSLRVLFWVSTFV